MATIVIKDKNLVPQNIKKGVTILKVTGTLEGGGGVNNQDKTVSSSTSNQTVTYDSGYTGLGTVTVNKYTLDTKTVNSSTSRQIITSDADGLLRVTVNPYTLDTKTVDPSTSQQTVNSSVDGLSGVTVNAVTSSIDGNIQAGNIKKDVTILGVTGTFEGGGGNDWILEAKLGNITDLSGYSLPNVSNNYQYAYMFTGTPITSAPDLSSITSINYERGCYGMFQDCSALTSVDLHNLTTVNATAAMSSMFSGCTNLTTVDLSSLTSYSGTIVVSSMFSNCNNLTTLRCHPNVFDGNNNSNTIAYQLGHIVNLTFTALTTPLKSVWLTKEPNLSAESVYSVLTHLNTSYSANCNFYSKGLTVTDYPDGRIQAAYDTAVAAGWTINNLTIVQPEPEPEPEPESQPCPACGGTGIDPETGETCSTCDGSGVIL